MRAIRVASAALLGMTALALSAPAAVAKSDNITPFGFSVLPSTIAAGGEVALLLERDHGGCKGSATVTSAVFDTITIPSHKSQAIAVVDWDARPGAVYRVTFTCDGVSGSTSLTIAAAVRSPPHRCRSTRAGACRPVRAAASCGFDLKEIGLGAALILGSVGTAYHLSRRRGGEDGA